MHRRLGTMMLRTTCVISFYYGNSYTHCQKLGTIIPWMWRNATLLYRDAFIQRRFYTQTLLLADTFYTQTLSHRDAFTRTQTFTHRRFYTRTLLHTDPFTHRPFYTHIVLHTDAFTHKGFSHRSFYTQTLLHTDVFTRRPFYTQTHLHAEAFTPRRFSTQKLLHTDSCTHTAALLDKTCYTQALLQADAFNTYQHQMMLWNRSETSWLRSANLGAQHSAEHIPLIWFTSRPKTSIKNPDRAQESPQKLQIARSCIIVHSYQDEIVCHRVWPHKHM